MRWLLILLLLYPVLLSAQIQQAWVQRYNAAPGDINQPIAIAIDSLGNIVVSSSISTNGDNDYVTIKYSPTGSQLWSARYASTNGANDELRAMALDKDGNVYLTGTSATVKYNSSGTPQWTAPYAGRALAPDTNGNVYVTGFSELDFVTVKLDPTGSNVWVRTYDRGWFDISQAVNVGEDGNIYVAGIITWAFIPRNSYYFRFGLVKYDSNGNMAWGINFPGFSQVAHRGSEVKGLGLDEQGFIYVSGNLDGEIAFAVSKITGSGNVLWNGGGGVGLADGIEKGMVVDGSGNVYVTGRSSGASTRYATAKISTSGTNVWEATYPTQASAFQQANAIALDAAANVYVTGQSPGPTTRTDFATVKYDTDGHQLWVQRYDGPGHDTDVATAITVSPAGEVYVTGWSANSSNLVEITTIKYAELAPIQFQTNNSVLLQFFGAPGQTYRFQATTNFPNWQDIGNSYANSNGIYSFQDTNAPSYPYRFYRTVTP